jgi:hypothetical protein
LTTSGCYGLKPSPGPFFIIWSTVFEFPKPGNRSKKPFANGQQDPMYRHIAVSIFGFSAVGAYIGNNIRRAGMKSLGSTSCTALSFCAGSVLQRYLCSPA